MKIEHCWTDRTVFLVPGYITAPAECYRGLAGTVVRKQAGRVVVRITTPGDHHGSELAVLPENLAASEPKTHRGATMPPLPSRAKPLTPTDMHKEVPLW
jgi:hypothetical protein